MIITEEMVREALRLVDPTVRAILNIPSANWGPQWVDGFISVPGVETDIPFQLGIVTPWNPAWGREMNFKDVALAKLSLAKRTGECTSLIVAAHPWQIPDGEYLYPGGASRLSISVGVSGAKGRVDEAIANIIIDAIIMLAQLEADHRIAEHEMQI